jgi:hypothetical protein
VHVSVVWCPMHTNSYVPGGQYCTMYVECGYYITLGPWGDRLMGQHNVTINKDFLLL